jgi:hypothetical protein
MWVCVGNNDAKRIKDEERGRRREREGMRSVPVAVYADQQSSPIYARWALLL